MAIVGSHGVDEHILNQSARIEIHPMRFIDILQTKRYVVEIDNTYIGALSKMSGEALRLCGKHGLAFDANYSAK